MTYNIEWSVFTQEEHERLNKMIELRAFNEFTNSIEEMTPDKERELQKLLNYFRPVVMDEQSEVMKKYIRERKEKGMIESPQSPEEEAELQAMLDEEMRLKQEEVKRKTDEQQDNLARKPQPPQPENRIEVIKETTTDTATIVPSVTSVTLDSIVFCDTCDSKGGRHKKECPKSVK